MDQRDDFVRTSLRIPKELWERLGEAAGRKRSLNAEIIARLEASFEARTTNSSIDVEHVVPKTLEPASDANLMLVDQDGFRTFFQLQLGEAIEQTMRRLVSYRPARGLGLIPDDNTTNAHTGSYTPMRRKPSRQKAKQMQEKAEDAVIYRKISPAMLAYWKQKRERRRKALARRKRSETPSTVSAKKLSSGGALTTRTQPSDGKKDLASDTPSQPQKVPFLSRQARKRAMKDNDES